MPFLKESRHLHLSEAGSSYRAGSGVYGLYFPRSFLLLRLREVAGYDNDVPIYEDPMKLPGSKHTTTPEDPFIVECHIFAVAKACFKPQILPKQEFCGREACDSS